MLINKNWDIILGNEMKQDYFKKLGNFVKEEYKRSPQIAAVSVKSCEEVYASLPDELKTHPDVLKEKRIWST